MSQPVVAVQTAPTPDGFAGRLRAATAPDHADAEDGGVLSRLAAGTAPIATYATLLTQLLPVYTALEQVADALRSDPVAGLFVDDALARAPRIAADLAAVGGETVLLPPATDYVLQILAAQKSPTAFVAHHYTRYLGDLSGGLAVGAGVRSAFGLTAARGASFFDFPGVHFARYKQRYRELLDTAPWSEAERAEVIVEVRNAYRLNIDLHRAVGESGAA